MLQENCGIPAFFLIYFPMPNRYSRHTRLHLFRTFIFLSVLLCAVSANARFSKIETKNLRLIYYGGAQAYLGSHVARCFENSLAFHRKLFGYDQTEKTTLILQDFGDYGNAGAGVLPWNHISLDIAPYNYAFETSPANERMNSTMNHELVHIVASNQTAGSDRFFRTIFGGKVYEVADDPATILYAYLTTPRRSAPRWYHEGIAVFLETWMAGGLGRALGAYDEMVFRTKVCDSAPFYDRIGLESEGVAVDFQAGVNSYLYGTRFMTYLALMYGPEKLIDWVKRTDGTAAFYGTQFSRVYGLSMDKAWTDWIAYEHQFQTENLKTIRQYPVTEARLIPCRPLGSLSRAYYDSANGVIYAAMYYPGEHAYVGAINTATGKIKKLCDVKGPAMFYVSSVTYDPESGTLFYTADNNEMRDLCAVDVKSGKQRMLMKDERVGDLAFSQADKSIWGVRHFNGISTLVRVAEPYNSWKQIYSFPYGLDLYDIDVAPDGKTLVGSLSEISGRQSLVSMDIDALLAGDTTYTTLYDFQNSIPENFTYSQDGKYIWGSSCYSGVSNIFRYDFETKAMGAFSNAETGLFRPMPLSADSLLVFRYSGSGFRPAVIQLKEIFDVAPITYLGQTTVEKHPILKNWIAPSPSTVQLDSATTERGEFNPITSIRPCSMYPIVQGYKEYTAIGMLMNFSSPIGLPKADVSVSYSPGNEKNKDEQFHAKASYTWLNWTFDANYNAADFYDLFGPTKTSRKGTSGGVTYKRSLIYDEPHTMDLALGIRGYTGLERLPAYQNVVTSFDKFLSFTANLKNQYLKSSIGAVDHEDGYRWQLTSSNQYVNEHLFTRMSADFDYGISLPIPHSSFWLRASAGYSPNDRDEPLANFFFGGFGNNWVDYQTEKRYRLNYSFPGVGIDALGGNNYVRAMAEWTLPPLRFKRLGSPTFYCTWVRAALFTAALQTNVDDAATRTTTADVGGQVDFRMALLSHLKITLSFGYAYAFHEFDKPTHERMISLKLL